MKKAAWMLGLTAAMVVPCARTALAQSSQQQDSSATARLTPGQLSSLPEPDITRIDEKKERVFLDNIDVIGEIPKPQAIFIIPGGNPQVDGIQIDRSFFREIFRPVEKDFFPQKGRRKLRAVIPW